MLFQRGNHLVLMIFFITFTLAFCLPQPKVSNRQKRQFDFTVSAEHDDDGTELIAEAVAKLWKSQDRNTQIDGTARVIHRSDSMSSGKTKYSASFHLRHDYRKK